MTNIRKMMSGGGISGFGGGPGPPPWGYVEPTLGGIYLFTWGAGITYDDQTPAEDWESGDSEPTHYSPYLLNQPGPMVDAAYPNRPGSSTTEWYHPVAGNGNFALTTGHRGSNDFTGWWAVGNNSYGVLGAPVPPHGHTLSGWTEVGRDNWITGETEPAWYRMTRSAMSYHSIQKEDHSGNPRGSLWGWGYNVDGRLGDGTTIDKYDGPVQIGSYTEWQMTATGNGCSMFLRDDGTLYTTGPANVNGHNNSTDYTSPTQLGSDQWSRISSGGCMGAIKYVGQGSGGGYGPALDTYGTLWTWGDGGKGRLGHGNETTLTVPTQVGTDTDWTDVACEGSQTTYALKSDGTMWGWGYNNHGQVGDGTTTDRWTPTQIGTGTDWGTKFGQDIRNQVCAGHNFMFQIKPKPGSSYPGGELWGWGLGYGRMGQGPNDTGIHSSPVQIGTHDDWIWVTGGVNHALGMRHIPTGGSN